MIGGKPSILVVDDDKTFVQTLVAAFTRKGLEARGCDKPWEIFGWRKRENFDFDLILLDMRLGNSEHGEPINAVKVLTHLMTYSPASKVVVFTQKDITVQECLKCIRLGTLGIIPKTANIDELILIADVYQHIGNQNESREELIRDLWHMVSNTKGSTKGQYLEMLIINIFNSIPTFKVIARNMFTNAGEIDVLVENTNQHEFWKKLDSLQLVIECKNRKEAAELTVLNQLKDLIAARGRMSHAGILVSVNSVTQGCKQRRNEIRANTYINIFFLEKRDLESLVRLQYDKREEYLRDVFSEQ